MSKTQAATLNKLFDFLKHAPAGVVADLNSTVKQAISTYAEMENHKTQRAQITAAKDVALTEMEKKYEILRIYLDKSFNERAEVLNGQFAAFERALDASQKEVAIAALNAIVETIKSSPLRGAGEIRQMMSSDGPIMLE